MTTRTYQRWTKEEDTKILKMLSEGASSKDIISKFSNRNRMSLYHRISKLKKSGKTYISSSSVSSSKSSSVSSKTSSKSLLSYLKSLLGFSN